MLKNPRHIPPPEEKPQKDAVSPEFWHVGLSFTFSKATSLLLKFNREMHYILIVMHCFSCFLCSECFIQKLTKIPVRLKYQERHRRAGQTDRVSECKKGKEIPKE